MTGGEGLGRRKQSPCRLRQGLLGDLKKLEGKLGRELNAARAAAP
jgi:hypothetical protein